MSDTTTYSNVLDAMRELGFTHYSEGTYYFSGGKTSSFVKLVKQLKICEELKKKELFKESHFVEIGDVGLVRYLVENSQPSNNNEGLSVKGVGSRGSRANKIREKIKLFVTDLVDRNIDPVGARRGGPCIVLVNVDDRTIVRGVGQSVDSILAQLGTTRENVMSDSEVGYCNPVFNPYTTDLILEIPDPLINGEKISGINTYHPPKWRFLGAKPVYGGWIKVLIEHLFPNPVEQERVLDWLHYAIVARNETVLTLAGDRGTGKSTFAFLLGALLGPDHVEYVKESILDGQFNPQMKSARAVIFEEVPLETEKGVAKIKSWCNRRISIEEKGQDPYTAEAHFSIVMLLNKLEDFKISPSERRFSIPKVTDKDLKLTMNEEEISKINHEMNYETGDTYQAIAEFGEFLLKRKPILSSQTPIRNDYFYTVSELSLTQWQSILIDYLIKNGVKEQPVNFKEVFANYDKTEIIVPDREDRVANFLRDYRHKGVCKVGSTVPSIDTVVSGHTFKSSAGRTAKFKRKFSVVPSDQFLDMFGDKYKGVKDEDVL